MDPALNDRNSQNNQKEDGAWLTTIIAVAIPLLATMADPHVTLWVTFAAMVVLALYQWRQRRFNGLVIFPAVGAAVVLSALLVFWLKSRH